ncbi:MAG: hypothetical protein PWQ91_1721 [Eubacteriales bacterium]|nr:hypothetical protein [Eubacteriales bacterium]
MVRTKVGTDIVQSPLKCKIRLDFRGVSKPGRLFFGSRSAEEIAEEVREQQISLLQNVPLQGTVIEQVDMSLPVYSLYDDLLGCEVAYAPAIITVTAETVEDLVRFIAREEFRTVEIVAPDNVLLTRVELERFLFRLSEEVNRRLQALERKYQMK